MRRNKSVSASDAQEFLGRLPMLLVVGAMDAESHADVLAYARGLAESQVIAKDACFIDVVSHNGRKIFEVQEGGLGRSITAWALQLLETEPGARVDVPLTEFRVASIRQTGTDLITVIHPPDEIRHAKAAEGIGSLFLGKPLAPFYGTARAIRSAMTALLVTSAVVFSVAGGVYFLKGSALDAGRYTHRFAAINPSYRTDITNLPSTQLDIAIQKLTTNGGYLSYIKYGQGRWSWAQATGSAASPKKGGAND